MAGLRRFTESLRKFHENEDGLEALTIVLILAVAAIILALITTILYPKVKEWAQDAIDKIVDFVT